MSRLIISALLALLVPLCGLARPQDDKVLKVSRTVEGAEDIFAAERQLWLLKAEQSRPELIKTRLAPQRAVVAVKDSAAFQGWRYEDAGDPGQLLYKRSFKQVKEITLDFGTHVTGYFSLHTKVLDRTPDAPVRIKLMFGELPAEMNIPLDPWQGVMSRGWMQDEYLTFETLDEYITLPRRVAFRYVRIELIGASPYFDFAIDDAFVTAVSSVGEPAVALSDDCPEIIRRIESVSNRTLHECMQTVFEDGPKRDHRLWVGDLYLQSLANRHSFPNFELVKRCLYLFAGLSSRDGLVMSNIMEHPQPHAQIGSLCLTYSLLFNSTLLEYLKDTGDYTTARELWKVAQRQTREALSYVGEDWIFDKDRKGEYVWLFFDWRDGLDVDTAMQGATIFALRQTWELASLLGCTDQVRDYPAIAEKMSRAARKKLYDRKRGVFLSGKDAQLSVLSQTWMIKAGVLGAKEGAAAIRNTLSDGGAVMPGTPYGTHYLIDAMLLCGLADEAKAYLTDYWGGMLLKGADTFWEAYDPLNEYITPYGTIAENSACHAWSCTPTYFIHEYPEIFQK